MVRERSMFQFQESSGGEDFQARGRSLERGGAHAQGMQSPPEFQHVLRLFVPQLRSQTVNRLLDLGDGIRRQVHLADGKRLAYGFQRNSSKGGAEAEVGGDENINP